MRSPKGCALLAYLLVTNQPQTREQVADLLWEANSTYQSLKNLRNLLSRIRPELPELHITRRTITGRLPEDTAIDLYQLQTALAARKNDLAALDEALPLYRGPLMDGFYISDAPRFNEWLAIAREQLHIKVLNACRRLADWHQEQDNWPEAVAFAYRWVALDDLDEEAHRFLMRFLAAAGRPAAALAHYQSLSQLLEKELDVVPADETIALYQQIAAQIQPPAATEDRSSTTPHLRRGRHHWGEAPGTAAFYGRETELVTLSQWLVSDRANVVTILGIGGQGKTTLAAITARSLADQFTGVFWRSLVNGPPLHMVLADYISYLTHDQVQPLDDVSDQLALLRRHLAGGRFLLVLDNMETILDGDQAGQFRPDYADYDRLVQLFGDDRNGNCLLATSREAPAILTRLAQQTDQIHTLHLSGLSAQEGTNIFTAVQIEISPEFAATLIRHYSGNPLALKLAAQTIQEFYFGDVAAFLDEESFIFDDIRSVLEQQFRRLTPLEQEILLWLAILREAATPQEVARLLVNPVRQIALLEAMKRLRRRSLLEREPHGFALQNVVTEFLTEHMIQQVCRELSTSGLDLLHKHALMLAQTKEYIRLSQDRMILQPVVKALTAECGTPEAVAEKVHALLDNLREDQAAARGYAAGNLLNLLLSLPLAVTAFDFSGLHIRQAYLQGAVLQDSNFQGADLSSAVFTAAFDRVFCLAASPDGKIVAGGTADGMILFWRIEDARLVWQTPAHTGSIMDLAFSPDGRLLASAGRDNAVHLWLVQNGVLQQTLAGHTNAVWTVAFSSDGRTLASGDENGNIYLWQLNSGEYRRLDQDHKGPVQTMVFSPDGQTLASGGDDQVVRLWTIPDGEIRRVLSQHTSWIRSLDFSPDGAMLASGGGEQDVLLWDVQSGQVARRFYGHTAHVRWLAFSPDGKTLASAAEDRTIRVWRVQTPDGRAGKDALQHTLRGHSDWAISVAYGQDGQTLISSGNDRTLHFWHVRDGRLIRSAAGYAQEIVSLAFGSHPNTLISGSYDQTARVWDLDTGRVRHAFRRHKGRVVVAASPDGETVASSSDSPDRHNQHIIYLWDVKTGLVLRRLQQHRKGQRALAFQPGGQMLASSGADEVIYLWDVASGQLRYTLAGPAMMRTLAFHPDGEILASAGRDMSIYLWDVSSPAAIRAGKIRQILHGHTSWIISIAISPDGQFLASYSADLTIRLWDMQRYQVRRVFQSPNSWAGSLAYSPNGQMIAAGSQDHRVRLWDVHTGRVCFALEGHASAVNTVAFDPHSELLASGSGDGTIRLWSVSTGRCIQMLRPAGPYAGMNISGATGITEAQKTALRTLGAEG